MCFTQHLVFLPAIVLIFTLAVLSLVIDSRPETGQTMEGEVLATRTLLGGHNRACGQGRHYCVKSEADRSPSGPVRQYKGRLVRKLLEPHAPDFWIWWPNILTL